MSVVPSRQGHPMSQSPELWKCMFAPEVQVCEATAGGVAWARCGGPALRGTEWSTVPAVVSPSRVGCQCCLSLSVFLPSLPTPLHYD